MSLKIVQLTDTHLFESSDGAQYGINTLRTLEAVVADVAARHADLDALLLTGDLSQDETPESYELLKRTLAPLQRAPFYAIPGNHDNLACMQECLPGERFFVGRDARLESWRFAMLNSQVPGRVHGELGAEQLTRLRQSLDTEERHTIVALHHPPVKVNSAWLDTSHCLDGQELLAILSDPPVKAVVCGHVHQAFETVAGGIPIVTTPSTCAQFAPGEEKFATDDSVDPGYRVFLLEDDGGWTTAVERVPVDQVR